MSDIEAGQRQPPIEPSPLGRDGQSTPRSLWSSPYLWAALAGLILIPLMRPLLRFEPDPPPVLYPLPDFELVDSTGAAFGLEKMRGSVHVVNFIFTRCPSICPLLTRSMLELDRRYQQEGVEGVRLLSITVDPEFDRPPVLAEYAHRHGIDTRRWSLLTGPLDEVRRVVVEGFKTPMGERETNGAGLMDIAHTGKLVLIDANGAVRGYYDSDELGLDEVFHRSQHVLRQGRRR